MPSQRIAGLDADGTWHIATSTSLSNMQTKCGLWRKVIALAIESIDCINPSGAVPPTAPRCAKCHLSVSASVESRDFHG